MSKTIMPSQTPIVAQKDVSGRDQRKGRTSGPKKTGGQNHTIPQFINVTNSTALDEKTRAQVRAQVMRDYHRRRVQKVDETENATRKAAPEPPIAKGQTQKFRFGKEKGLQPWVPVKGSPGKRRRVADRGRGKASNLEALDEAATSSSSVDNEQIGNLFDASEFLDSNVPSAAPTDTWLSSLDFAIQASILYPSPGSGLLDPFAATSLLITPRTQILIHHYFNERFQSSWLMMPMRKMLFSMAINDAAMFHSFLCHYSGSYNVNFQTGNKSEALYHASMAAKIVNERLADPTWALSNETIATVANMASFESSNGSVDSMLVHIEGLEKMVRMRGGIESGGFPMIVQRMIAWTDYHAATAVLSKPRFPPLNIPKTEKPGDFFYPSISQDSDPSKFRHGDAIEGDIREHGIDQLFDGIRELSKLLKEIKKRPNLPEDNIWYSDMIYYLQRNLIEVVYCADTPRPLDRVCATAGVMYCGRCLRDVPFSFQVIARAVTRLRDSIVEYQKENSPSTDTGDQIKMFWILAFGGAAAEGKPERDWFVANFKASCDALDIYDWETAKGVLESVLWQSELDDAASKLWLEAILVDF